jgi:ABC transporter substrate binding protein
MQRRRCACAAAGAAGGRVSPDRVSRYQRTQCGGVPQRPQRNWLRRRPERDGRVLLAGGPIRAPAGADSRSGPPPGGRDRHDRHPAGCARGESCNSDDPNRLRRRYRPGPAWSRRQPARPGGNATGIYFLTTEITGKRLRLLHELVPKAVRIAVLVNPSNGSVADTTILAVQEAAPTLGLQIQILKATTIGEIDTAFATLVRERFDALFVDGDALFLSRRAQFATLTARDRIPATFSVRDYVEAGGLMSYGTDIMDWFRQVGVYTGKILKGAKPVELPVLQSTKFEFVINLQTARALGIEVPPGVISVADEVIE